MSDMVTRTRIGNTVDNDLLVQFKELSEKTRIPMSKLLDEALKDLLNKYSARL